MKELIMIHEQGEHSNDETSILELNAVSNSNGVFSYFVDKNSAYDFAFVLENTIPRIELLLDTIEISENDETSYNELELIYAELNKLRLRLVP